MVILFLVNFDISYNSFYQNKKFQKKIDNVKTDENIEY